MYDTSISSGSGQAAGSVTAAISDFASLMKPRVMSLVVFTGLVGLYLAPGDMHPVLQVVAIVCIAMGAGASGAINMWYDRDIDAIMARTRSRPIPAGRVDPEAALVFGVIMAGGSVIVLGLATNWLAAALLAVTIAFYVFIYTMWLKRRTPQNIVIGGAAGALPPVIGWAALTGSVSIDTVVLFAIIFIWTPPHFWALALYRSDDYKAAGIPMLPVVSGRRETQNSILAYSLILAPCGMVPAAIGTVGWVYGIAAAVLGGLFVLAAWKVWRDASTRHCKQLFAYSILYLFLLFLAMVIDRTVGIAAVSWIGS